MTRVRMIEVGIALGLVIALILLVTPTEQDDFSRVFRPAGQGRDPYASGVYFYPAWNTWILRGGALLPRAVGLALVWTLNVIVVLACTPVWATPGWMGLLSPPFIACLFFGHPFEAAVFAGLSLASIGYRDGHAWMMGLGLALCMFKPQMGLLPAVWVGLCMLGTQAGRRAWWIPTSLVLATTILDWGFSGQLWMGPWWRVIQQAPQVVVEWNASLVQGFHFFSVLWLPIGLWLCYKIENFQRRLWLAMAIGLLVSPYWAGYSLWPLVAMAGCWQRRRWTSWRVTE